MSDKSRIMFQAEIERLRRCSPEEMEDLIPRAAEGSQEALDRLVEGNLYRVYEAAAFFTKKEDLFMDLLQEGNLALLLCLSEEYEYTESTERRMDAAVHEAMERFMEEEQAEKKIGEELKTRLNVLDEVCVRLTESLGREPTAEEVAELMKMDPGDVKYLLKIALSAIKKD